MPHDKMAHISGMHHVRMMKGSDFEHDGHITANPPGTDGMTEREMEKIGGVVHRKWVMVARRMAIMSGVPQAAHFQESPIDFYIPHPNYKRGEEAEAKVAGIDTRSRHMKE